jgi:death-on-curing protein
MTKYLSLKEVLRLHFQVIEDYGGSHGTKDEGRLSSLVIAPRQEVFGAEQYPGIFQKAAVYIRNLIGDHAFVDGNKRTAVTVAAIFMSRNGYKLTATPKELEDFAVSIAVDKPGVTEIAAWLKARTKKI